MGTNSHKLADQIVRLNIPITNRERRMAKIAALEAGIDLKDFAVMAIMEKIERDGDNERV